ncbi:topoisomerase [Lysinibacillus cavernae]|uniref:topoisomerase n=1 Tax=Lysinibacillus cavernae TaxID=2666135 RepID=UPI001E5359B0|nr:topoisomerase [Lysinibacillus cavernae]
MKGEVEVLKKTIISGIVFTSILLVGCNGEEKGGQLIESEQEAVVAPANEGNDELKLLSELKNEIIVSITEQSELDSESIAIMVDGNPFKEMTISVSFPKDVKVDDTMIQQIIEDSIKKVSETENVTISEENIKIKIETYREVLKGYNQP